jgi:hypothetical protein
MITVTSVDLDLRYIVTADSGPDSLIIIWDLKAGHADSKILLDIVECNPIKTIFEPHDGCGTLAAEFTPDVRYLITLGAGICV